jgi:chromosome segregation protein
VSAPARLLGLRVQGFKSFAERTLVEFGEGISAIVGPNGSGKSNLADALRWALGEQGRSLRIRRSEDVIWAGSDRRAALGMADVTLVLDNSDALLPVEYSVVELGRRLYRSGENDYLLNRHRVRLRDLVDLLDSANLAENAFLFIGQGMVDQALALRPEERRPLFEEVAGVRRHERRRRKAEDQLVEAEANLARVEDILSELRPQARRLGQLAEQQATRLTAGEELAAALIAAAHGRWHEAAGRAHAAETRRDALRVETERALEALEAAESTVGEIAASLAARAEAERDARAAHETARTQLTALGLREARATGELHAAARDRTRITTERSAAEADLATHRRILAEPVAERDPELDAALGDADRALAEALSELGSLRAASRARGDELAALRRAEAARASEAETARRRASEAMRRAADGRARAVDAAGHRGRLETALQEARAALAAATAAESAAAAEREQARATADAAEGTRRAVTERAARAGAMLATARGRLEQLERRLAEEEERGIARAARRLGGRRVDEDLGIDPSLRAAVEAALGDLARAYVVGRDGAGSLGGERGHLVVRERLAPADGAERAAGGASAAGIRRLDDALAAAGGGRLADAVRKDPNGAARTVLSRAAWAPDLAAVLEVQERLPSGWIVVARDGSAVADALTLRVGRGESPLEHRAEAERLAREVAGLEADAAGAERESSAASQAAADARSALDRARSVESAAVSQRRRAEDLERGGGAGGRVARGAGGAAGRGSRSDLGGAGRDRDPVIDRTGRRRGQSVGRGRGARRVGVAHRRAAGPPRPSRRRGRRPRPRPPRDRGPSGPGRGGHRARRGTDRRGRPGPVRAAGPRANHGRRTRGDRPGARRRRVAGGRGAGGAGRPARG